MERAKKDNLIIRADADTAIGTGHMMRCLALGQGWKDNGGEVTFITACRNENLLRRLNNEKFNLCLLANPYPDDDDWSRTGDILSSYPGSWLVLDGYHFDEKYQQRMKDTGHKILVIDDMAHLKHYYADIVLNQNLGAEKLHYSCEPHTRLLLGTRYVLLRREFQIGGRPERKIPEIARKVLVTMGGSDPTNVTLDIIKSIQEINVSGLEAIIIAGAGNPNMRALEDATKESRIPIRLVHDAENMPELIAWADVAVSAGGSTTWELAFMGLPFGMITIADNQREITKNLAVAGVALDLGWYPEANPDDIRKSLISFLLKKKARVEMSNRGKQIVDGQGVSRVVLFLIKGGGMNEDYLFRK